MKSKITITLLTIVLGIALFALYRSFMTYDEQTKTIESVVEEKENLSTQLTASLKDNVALKQQIKDLNAKIEEAEPWFALKEEERQAEADALAKREADKKAKAEAEAEAKKLAEEQKQRAEEEAKKQAEAKKYENSNITYKQLKKGADPYAGEPVRFTGEVIQIQSDGGNAVIRVAVTRTSYGYDPNDIIMLQTDLDTSEIYEEDVITFDGDVVGDYTYQSTAGWDITVPLVTPVSINQ